LYKVVHLEPTDVCQAACPLCARELDPAFNKSLKHHLTIQQVQQHVSDKDIANLDKMFMCGNYGDPAAGLHTLQLYRYFRDINPNITLGMNSNGAIQNIAWWSELAGILSRPKDYVVFSIDGLQDTNHIYRKHVSWRKLMDNAETFINAGGHAHWDMLVYKHNEHQVDACEQLARDMGFKWFRAKVSKREYINGLEQPTSWQRPTFTVGKIECHALAEQSLYIDAQGRKSPCCWLGARQQDFVTDINEVATTWNTNSPDPVCVVTCTTKANITVFESQWQREVELC
jgi:MoaA/NifB/PqqE/SkfB family radical SAM enzyme